MAKKRPFTKKISGTNSAYSLVNPMYKTKLEFMENMTIYKPIIKGEMDVSSTIDYGMMKHHISTIIKSYRLVMLNSNTLPKIRQYFNFGGKTVYEISDELTTLTTNACLCVLLVLMNQRNVDEYLFTIGITNIQLPLFLIEWIRLLRQSKLLNTIPGIENSMINFSLSTSVLTPPKEELQTEAYFIESVYRLQLFCKEILPASHSAILNKFHDGQTSNTFMSCSLDSTNGKEENIMYIGSGVTSQAIIWCRILGLKFHLSQIENHEEIFSPFKFVITKSQIKNAILLMNTKLYGNGSAPVIDQESNVNFKVTEVKFDS